MVLQKKNSILWIVKKENWLLQVVDSPLLLQHTVGLEFTFLKMKNGLCGIAGMAQLIAGLQRLGLEFIQPYGNFITFRCANAAETNQKLLRQGVIVRPIAGYGLPDWLRGTIGSEAENERFLEALETS